MKLFISWSGEFSRKVAECLSIWIPTIIQTVDVFYSPNDIAKGENWSSRLSDELEQSNFGIVCLTPENTLAPWIHFEAGALSKVANSRVSAIMLGISPSDVKGPLARFQNTAFTREDFYRLFLSINSSHEAPLRQAVLEHAFDNSWEKLERDITAIIEEYSSRSPASSPEESLRDEHGSNSEAIQEILSIVRTFGNNSSTPVRAAAVSSINSTRAELNQKIAVIVSCASAPIHDVLRIIQKYSYASPKSAAACESSLSAIGSCSIITDTDQLPALTKELCEIGAEVLARK